MSGLYLFWDARSWLDKVDPWFRIRDPGSPWGPRGVPLGFWGFPYGVLGYGVLGPHNSLSGIKHDRFWQNNDSSFDVGHKMMLTLVFFSCVLVMEASAGGKCETTADCVAPNVCSKWGWCQWTKIYGKDLPKSLATICFVHSPWEMSIFVGFECTV